MGVVLLETLAVGKSANGGPVPCLDPSLRIFYASCSTISVWIN